MTKSRAKTWVYVFAPYRPAPNTLKYVRIKCYYSLDGMRGGVFAINKSKRIKVKVPNYKLNGLERAMLKTMSDKKQFGIIVDSSFGLNSKWGTVKKDDLMSTEYFRRHLYIEQSRELGKPKIRQRKEA